MLYVQENPTNKPNFAINELAGSRLPTLYRLIEQFGKNRITALSLPKSASKTLIEHRDLLIANHPGRNRKMYILSLHIDGAKKSLIADFRAKEEITRTMFFDGNTFQESIKVTRASTSDKSERSILSELEQVAYLNELKEPIIDLRATQELPAIALSS